MAIKKAIIQPDGITCDYHRVVRVDIMVNDQIMIETASYPSAEVRKMQKMEDEKIKTGESMGRSFYSCCNMYFADYQESFSVTSAYEFLKTLPTYEGAEDV